MRYAVIYEATATGFSGYLPDLREMVRKAVGSGDIRCGFLHPSDECVIRHLAPGHGKDGR
jgi:hypothetical protein